MTSATIHPLEHSRRDALVSYYLGQLAPDLKDEKQVDLKSPNDLYEYLLIDNQVAADVDGSVVSTAIASVQQYINAVYNGMEPGYSGFNDDTEVQQWRNSMSEYAVWAGYQMLLDYPENYIDPTLRLGSTKAFDELVNELNQSRISQAAVQKAVLRYLSKFEDVSNLEVLAGYINSGEEGIDFLNADYYFIGKENTPAGRYYWRKAAVALKKESTALNPAAWSEWLHIDVLAGADILHVRPVVMSGRLYMAWVERLTKKANDPNRTTTFSYEIKLSYLATDLIWSVPKIYAAQQDQSYVNVSKVLLAFTLWQNGKANLILHHTMTSGAATIPFIMVLDEFMTPVLNKDLSTELGLASELFSGSRRLQYTLVGSDSNRSIDVIIDPTHDASDLTKSMSLFVKPSMSTGDKQIALEVSGVVRGKEDESAFGYVQLEGSMAFPDDWGGMTISASLEWSYPDVAKLIITSTKSLSFSYNFIMWGNGKPYRTVTLDSGKTRVEEVFSASAFSQLLELNEDTFKNNNGWLIRCFDFGIFKIPLNGKDRKGSSRFAKRNARLSYGAGNKQVWQGDLTLNGNAVIPWVLVKFEKDVEPIKFEFTDNDIPGSLTFELVMPTPIDTGPKISSNSETVLNTSAFLDFEEAAPNPNFRYIRLNTQFASKLVSAASVSIDKVLSWETQHLKEPPFPGSTAEQFTDFSGANGRYFWELYFHVPHLVAQRLHSEMDFNGAEQWLHHMFNPQVRERPTWPAIGVDYWATRPLLFVDVAEQASSEVVGPVDPDAMSYSAPSHYRKTIFMLYVRNLIAWGDSLYRGLTRDSLNEAKLHYVRALSLLGPTPDSRTVGRWNDQLNLATISGPQADAYITTLFENTLVDIDTSLPELQGQPWFSLLGNQYFRLPVNTHLLALWTDIDARLYTLRHNLTLDGKPLQLALYEKPINPSDLLRAQNGASGMMQRGLGGKVAIPPYRFRAILPRVQNALETLTRFGDQVRLYREQKERGEQEELAQSHVMALADFGIGLQREALEQAKANKAALQISKQTVESRKAFYTQQIKNDVSGLEKAHLGLQIGAAALHGASIYPNMAGAILDALPNLFGVGNGGQRYGAVAYGEAQGLASLATVAQITGDYLLTSDQYHRRKDEWRFQEAQAQGEMEILDKQLEAQDSAIRLAEQQVDYALNTVAQAKDMYSFLKTRTTNASLYGWLLSQLSTFYFQAYDAVLSLCLSVERCWQYEMGDEATSFIQPNVWFDNYFGLTAGEALKLQVLRMESAYLRRHERRLEIVKTVSLKKLLGHATIQEAIDKQGECVFNLDAQDFDLDYPGHYLRQISHVSISFPVTVGAYQNVRATLTQNASRTLLKPNLAAVQALHKDASAIPDDVVANLRSSQSIGLSTGLDDDGQFMLDFGDERYLPFEGTGAISSWTLTFPRPKSLAQQEFLALLPDIIVHIRYSALEGGQAFRESVEALLSKPDLPPQMPRLASWQ